MTMTRPPHLDFATRCSSTGFRQVPGALVLTEFEGLTQVEMAEELGLSVSGAKSRVQRARAMLRDDLLECCHFEFDRLGHVIDYEPRPRCCPRSRALRRPHSGR